MILFWYSVYEVVDLTANSLFNFTAFGLLKANYYTWIKGQEEKSASNKYERAIVL